VDTCKNVENEFFKKIGIEIILKDLTKFINFVKFNKINISWCKIQHLSIIDYVLHFGA